MWQMQLSKTTIINTKKKKTKQNHHKKTHKQNSILVAEMYMIELQIEC